jgi:hypothetical protein
MEGAAVATMVAGMVIIWGGLLASIANAVIKSRRGR